MRLSLKSHLLSGRPFFLFRAAKVRTFSLTAKLFAHFFLEKLCSAFNLGL